MFRISAGVGQQFRQIIAQKGAKRGDIITAVLKAVIIKLLSHAVRAAFHARADTRPVIFVGWSDSRTGVKQKRARDEQREFRIAHDDFLIGDRAKTELR
ncbi:hypothetical protein SARI_02037 [Salmonella enterica subsp. arizonae serovar 62:z4,z23:-]|uniref:Uncharacterized protein n=1 Tax=Salmonella arizonae (strain ATCC BAA-731 / CDC346-86 / RSK2980) TaxID=41514 RepID=A9MIL3_SALAR|nr:hypothetical protein SARI_02037 [Salmonella enterica subsp. arizonae serovar 62:z4,z23:-]